MRASISCSPQFYLNSIHQLTDRLNDLDNPVTEADFQQSLEIISTLDQNIDGYSVIVDREPVLGFPAAIENLTRTSAEFVEALLSRAIHALFQMNIAYSDSAIDDHPVYKMEYRSSCSYKAIQAPELLTFLKANTHLFL